MRTRAVRDSMNGWAQETPARACAELLFSFLFFFMNGGPEKNLTRDCWGWLSLL